MIEGHCWSNDDNLQGVRWPTRFAIEPRIGHRVRSMCGKHERKIVGITHIDRSEWSGGGSDQPYVSIELDAPYGEQKC